MWQSFHRRCRIFSSRFNVKQVTGSAHTSRTCAKGWTSGRVGRRGQAARQGRENQAPSDISVEEAEPPHTDAGKDQPAE
jgi:hypothetical protein